MELILINDSKLKVTLTADDMSKFALSCDNLDYDNTETRRAFWQILDEAKHKTGFDAASDRVFIQVYPSKCGGCEMYVIKLKNMITSSEPVKNSPTVREKRSVYSFDTIGMLLPVCKQLHNLGYDRESAAYSGDDGKFYLVVTERPPAVSCKNPISEFGFLEEYGRKFTGNAQIAYIQEHCKVIDAKNAVNILAALA